MRMIEIVALQNGAHNNQTYHGVLPEGWAIVPEDMVCENFPFGEVTVEDISGRMTVTRWAPIDLPDNPLVKDLPSQLDIVETQVTYTAMMTDTLLEG